MALSTAKLNRVHNYC